MSAILFRSLFVLGIIAFIAVLIFAEAGPAQPFQPTVPSFINPFQEEAAIESYTLTAVPTNNSTVDIFGTNAFATFVLCEDISLTNETNRSRVECVKTPDGDVSYWEITIPEATDFYMVSFNLSNPSLIGLSGPDIRSISWSVQCWTISGPREMTLDGIGGLRFIGGLSCPKEGYKVMTKTNNFPSGVGGGITEDSGAIFFPDDNYTTYGVVRVSYISITIVIVKPTGQCVAPAGAWFPWVDETACALGNIGQTAWKGLLFIFRGGIYVGEWFIAAGQFIANYLTVLVWLYAIPGMPIILQGFIDVFITILFGSIAIEVLRLIKPFGD